MAGTGHLAKDCPRLKKESEPDSNQPDSFEPEDMESESVRTPEPTQTSDKPTSIPTLQETLGMEVSEGENLNDKSSPPAQGSDENELARERLPEQTFSNVSLTREFIKTLRSRRTDRPPVSLAVLRVNALSL